MPPGSSHPTYRADRTPYMVPLLRAAARRGIKRAVCAMASQGGKSQAIFTLIGWKLDLHPQPVLYIAPTANSARNVVEPKLDHMLRTTASLWRKTARGQAYKRIRKLVSGVSLRLAWGGSPTELAADSAAWVFVDELDRIAKNVRGDGNVSELADARHGSYDDGRTVTVSSPTLGNVETYEHPETGIEHWKPAKIEDVPSPIWRLWQEGSRHEWAWPCPHCGEYFIPRMSLLWWPEDAEGAAIERKAMLRCPRCDALIGSEHKAAMNLAGRALAPGQWVDGGGRVCGPEPDTVDYSLWISGLANLSAAQSFGSLARRLAKARASGEQERVQGVVNTAFGECYKFGGDAPHIEAVRERCDDYASGEVPDYVNWLTCFVDVSRDRFWYAVRGWGSGYRSALIDADEILGDTARARVWEQLHELYLARWHGYQIVRMGVDSGYRADEVYGWTLARRRALAMKGHATLARPVHRAAIEVNVRGEKVKRGIELWHWDTDFGKAWVHARLGTEADERDGEPVLEPNAWALPSDVTDEYCHQLVAEERAFGAGGKPRWHKVRRDNHYLDCEAGNYVLARIVRSVGRRIGYSQPSGPASSSARDAPLADEAAPALAARNVARAPRSRTISKGIEL